MERHVICVDAFDECGSKPPEVSGSSDSVHITTPNTSVLVMVRHAQGTALRIAMAGQPGLTTLGYQNTVSPQGGESKRGPAVEAPPPTPVITTHSFAPRKPGSADIRVQLYDDANRPLHNGGFNFDPWTITIPADVLQTLLPASESAVDGGARRQCSRRCDRAER